MAKLRIVDPTGWYHVTSRGNYRQPIFVDVDHYERHLFMLDRVVQKFGWLVLDWCQLPNHFHLFIQLQDGGLSEGMQRLNGGFSRWTNSMHGRTGTGHLVKNRFVAKPVTDESHLLEICRYLPLNPVAAGLATQANEWRWTGYRATSGLEHPQPFHRPELVLQFFDRDPAKARIRLAEWVEAGHAQLRRVWAQTALEARQSALPPDLS